VSKALSKSIKIVEILVLLYAFFLKLSCCEGHVHSYTALMKSTLTFTEKVLLEVVQFQKYLGQNFASDRQEGDSAMVVAQLTISLAFADV